MNTYVNDLRTIQIEDVLVNQTAEKIIEKLVALQQLGLPSSYIFEVDDGPDGYATVDSLVAYTYQCGGYVIDISASSLKDACPIVTSARGAGKYLVFVG